MEKNKTTLALILTAVVLIIVTATTTFFITKAKYENKGNFPPLQGQQIPDEIRLRQNGNRPSGMPPADFDRTQMPTVTPTVTE